MIDRLHQDMYTYQIYNEYLNQIKNYTINSNYNSLSIRYYKQNFGLTKNVYDELDIVASGQYNRVYEIYDFVPVLDAQPLTYTNEDSESSQGVIRKTFGTITTMVLEKPLPGDIFNYYNNDSISEYFEIKEVNFIQSVSDIDIYQLNFETCLIHPDTINAFDISEHYYYLKEFEKFYDKTVYPTYKTLLSNRNDIITELDKFYNYQLCKYDDVINFGTYDIQLPDILTQKVNSILLYLNQMVQIDNRIILGYEILYNDKLIIKISQDDLYIPDRLYQEPPYDPSAVYNPYAGKVKSNLMELVYRLQNLYFIFFEYQSPVDGTSSNIEVHEIFEPNNNLILDLDSNIITQG